MVRVSSVTGFGRNGVSDWLVQRISAVILGIYLIGMLAYLLINRDLDFAQWQTLFQATWMRIATLLALLALCAHAWIGMWTVATDYLTPHMLGPKANTLRFLFLAACVLLIFIYLVWGIQILWGN
jgi:succinate dehydrogenase / fumarate reductase, membrane anchor subunit